ncbi:MAG: hypothetical protein ACPGFA_14335 [Pikeienuella sp.]
MTQVDAIDTAVAVENQIFGALGGMDSLETTAAISIAGRVSLQMSAIVGDAILKNGSTESRNTALRYIEDAMADLAVLKTRIKGPHPVHS